MKRVPTLIGRVRRVEVGDAGGRFDLAGAEQVPLPADELGGLGDGVGGAYEVDLMQAAEFERDAPPGLAGGAFGHPDEQDEPAQHHVGVDAVGEAVDHRAQLEVGLEVAEAAEGGKFTKTEGWSAANSRDGMRFAAIR